MTFFHGLLAAVVAARLLELLYARRNTARLLAQGGQEVGAAHYPLIVALHTAWLLSLAWFIPPETAAEPLMLFLFLLTQGLRIWVLVSLGRYWTTRIITLPGVPLVRRGPYRYLRHPNYLVVALELALLPLCFGAWELAVIFSLLNAAVLSWRIRTENAVLAARRPLEDAVPDGRSQAGDDALYR